MEQRKGGVREHGSRQMFRKAGGHMRRKLLTRGQDAKNVKGAASLRQFAEAVTAPSCAINQAATCLRRHHHAVRHPSHPLNHALIRQVDWGQGPYGGALQDNHAATT